MISTYATQNWITVIIVFLVALLVLLHYLYENRFLKFISLIKTNEYFLNYIDKKKIFISFFDTFLFFLQLGIYGLFIYFIKLFYHKNDYEFLEFLKITSTLCLFLVGRYLVGKIIAYIFKMHKAQGELSLAKFTYLSKVAVYLFPLIIILNYLPYYGSELLLITTWIMLLMLLYFYSKLLLQNQKLIFRNLFYFILYLCTLEIIPLVYLYKTIF